MKEKKALTKALAQRYRTSSNKTKTKILDEFVSTSGYNQKYAIHVLSNYGLEKIRYIDEKAVKITIGQKIGKKRVGRPRYDPAVKKAIIALWKFFDYMCGKRLVVFIRANIELLCQQPELKISNSVQTQLLQISATTIDRMLSGERKKLTIKGRTHTKHGPLLKHQIPIRTNYTWDERQPGFFELDTVGHDGGSAIREYCFTLTATDVFSGWTEVRALRNRAHRWVKEHVQDIVATLPFPVKRVDSDNGGEFINRLLVTAPIFCFELPPNRVIIEVQRLSSRNVAFESELVFAGFSVAAHHIPTSVFISVLSPEKGTTMCLQRTKHGKPALWSCRSRSLLSAVAMIGVSILVLFAVACPNPAGKSGPPMDSYVPADFGTIQAAIDNASAGESILS